MTCAKNRVSLKIQVHPMVYDFYISKYGESFDVDQDDMIAIMIPHILTLRPKDYVRKRYLNYKDLDVVIHDFRFGHQNESGGGYNMENKSHLSDNHQYYISRFLDRIFKSIFHNYMLAYVRASPKSLQKDGILDFCMVYRIGDEQVNFDMLKKSWDRSKEKKQWKSSVVKKC